MLTELKRGEEYEILKKFLSNHNRIIFSGCVRDNHGLRFSKSSYQPAYGFQFR